MIARYGGCTFEEKVRNAMNANYSAAIVYNVDSNKVILEEVTLFNRLIFTFSKMLFKCSVQNFDFAAFNWLP